MYSNEIFTTFLKNLLIQIILQHLLFNRDYILAMLLTFHFFACHERIAQNPNKKGE